MRKLNILWEQARNRIHNEDQIRKEGAGGEAGRGRGGRENIKWDSMLSGKEN